MNIKFALIDNDYVVQAKTDFLLEGQDNPFPDRQDILKLRISKKILLLLRFPILNDFLRFPPFLISQSICALLPLLKNLGGLLCSRRTRFIWVNQFV
jgi:hypothetical protein